MLKRNITYETFDGDEVTEPYYFNISKSELVELEVEFEGGFGAMLQRIVETNDRAGLVREFKKLILMAYGVKSDDGKRFVKSDELRDEFTQTAAYNSLFMELATNDGAAVEFVMGVLPKDMRAEIGKEVAKAPSPPTAPTT
jgi:hypothetical protein